VFPKKAEKSPEVKEETKETTTEIKEDVKDAKDEEKETKERRSASRKRNSFFGGLVLGKKDDKSDVDEAAVTDSSKDVNTEPKKVCRSKFRATSCYRGTCIKRNSTRETSWPLQTC